MHKGFCNNSSSQRPMPFAYPSVSSFFSSKPLVSVPLPWLSQFQLSLFAFPPRSLLEYQSPNNSHIDISSQFLAQMCTSYLIPALSSMTLPNLPLFQCFSQAVSILDLDMWTLLYIHVAICPPFCPAKLQLITFPVVAFLSSPSFPPHSLPLLAPSPCLPPVRHPAASHSFPHSPQLPDQNTTLQRQAFKNIFKGIKQHILPLTFLSEMVWSLGCYLSKFSTSSRHQLRKSAAKTVKASQSYKQLNTRSYIGTGCAALTTYSAICLSWNLTYI